MATAKTKTATASKASLAAQKGVATRRANALRLKRSEAALKGAATRRAKLAATQTTN